MRWRAIIYLYYRAALPSSAVADRLKLSDKIIRDTVTRIERAAKGVRTTGKVKTQGKPGRPKKVSLI
jgi:hypothetical protein